MALNKEEKEKIVKEFGLREDDTGSAQLQIAFLTENIRRLTQHLKDNPKDFSSKRGLLKMVSCRRRFLKYIENNDESRYRELIERLGLKR